MPNLLRSESQRPNRTVLGTARTLLRAVTFTAVLMSLSLLGCAKTTWSKDAPSPDGKWTAKAHTVTTSGWGTGDINTTVSLTWSGGSTHSPFTILQFEGNNPNLILKWTDASHLLVTYTQDETIWLQVAQYSQVHITLQKCLWNGTACLGAS